MAAGGIRVCSMCGQAYGPEYADTFCPCGFELLAEAGSLPEVEAPPSRTEQSAGMSPCLVLYGPKREVLQRFPLEREITVVGRQDPVEAVFPEIDLAACLDPATARRVSREHVAIVHSRQDGSYSLRPMPGNTGTQLEADMISTGQDYPLRPGNRIILGGAVRFKFE